MPAEYRMLSASTDGKGILIGTTATLIHTSTALTGNTEWDQIFLWFSNTDTSSRSVQVFFGDSTTAMNLGYTIVANIPYPFLTGQILHNAKTVYASAGVANKIVASGYVIRRT